jgi:hypothetical protein
MRGEIRMKRIKILVTCSILMTSVAVLAANDPEMDYIDMSPDNRAAPPAGIDKPVVLEATATING